MSDVAIRVAARFTSLTGECPFVTVSMYARWLRLHPTTGSSYIYSDAAAHHIISDLSAFIGDDRPGSHRILVADDLNNIYGATEDNELVWYQRHRGVFRRMDGLDMEFAGRRHPEGRLAAPPPQDVREDTMNVPTYHTTRRSPATAENHLDYVFASRGFHLEVRARALNDVEQWEPATTAGY